MEKGDGKNSKLKMEQKCELYFRIWLTHTYTQFLFYICMQPNKLDQRCTFNQISTFQTHTTFLSHKLDPFLRCINFVSHLVRMCVFVYTYALYIQIFPNNSNVQLVVQEKVTQLPKIKKKYRPHPAVCIRFKPLSCILIQLIPISFM